MTTVDDSAADGVARAASRDADGGGEQRLLSLLRLSCDWCWEMDESLRFTAIQRMGSGRLTPPDEQILGRRGWELQGDLIRPADWGEHRSALEARQPFRDLIVRRLQPDGQSVYHSTSGDPVFDAGGRFRGYRGVGRDITEQVRTQESVERLAAFDALTRLPNRRAFDERAQRMLSDAYEKELTCAMLYIDLDDFGLLNKGYGHRIGDEVLSLVAERMRSVVREPHLLGRRGGDELVALLVDVPGREAAVETSRRLIEAISRPAHVFGMEITVTASIGIAFFPQDSVDLDSLLNAADAAMFQAKERARVEGRNTHALYTPTVKRRLDLQLRLEQGLRRAFEARDFRLVYQPLVSMSDGRMVGAEALLRWRDVERGDDISPAEFIPIAEKSGLIVELGDWVLREACRQIQIWRQVGVKVPPIAINMSGKQLQQKRCVDDFQSVLRQFGMRPSDIEIEVTETDMLDVTQISRENLRRLHDAGVKVALDDFGVGFSSLSHLRDLPISRLKIDRSFTVACMKDERTLTIVKAVIGMAHQFGPRLDVTAEGIETLAHQKWMQHLGCDSAQGFLLARPMSPEDFVSEFADSGQMGSERSLMR